MRYMILFLGVLFIAGCQVPDWVGPMMETIGGGFTTMGDAMKESSGSFSTDDMIATGVAFLVGGGMGTGAAIKINGRNKGTFDGQ